MASDRSRPSFRGKRLETLARLEYPAAIEWVKQGLPALFIRQLNERLEVPLESLAKPLHLAPRTLHRRIQEGRLDQNESERLLAIARLFLLAVDILGNETKAAHWFKNPIKALNNRSPLECTETLLGMRQVENTLLRIEDVVYS